MGDSEETAAQSVLSGDDDNPLAGQDLSGGPSGQPQPTTSSTATASPIQVDSTQKVHPHVAILAGLVNKVLGGLQNASGNPNNAFDRGFAQASPQNQQLRQAQVSQAMSDADTAKAQASITGMKAIQLKYQIARMPEEQQEKYLTALGQFKQFAIKEGAEVVATPKDQEAGDAEARSMNENDPRAKANLGKFWSIPEPLEPGKQGKFDILYIPEKDVLQHDEDIPLPNGKTLHLEAGLTHSASLAKMVEALGKNAKDDSQDFIKEMHGTLGNQKAPENQADADQRLAVLDKFIGLAGKTDPVWTQLAQTEKANIQRIYRSLPSTAQAGKERQAAAGAARTEEKGLKGKDVIVHTDQGEVLMSSHEAQQQGFDDFSTLTAQKSQDLKDKRANADASMTALTQYEQTFRESAPKLSSGDRDAMRVLTSHIRADAGTGVLGGVIESLPLVGPLSTYANKMLEGTMTSDQYKNLSPEGKRMMAQYAMAVVANFANMKQMLGSVGRNPQMIQAEMAQIPLPYIDPKSAQEAFTTKREDLERRNSSIPKVYSKREEKLKKGMSQLAGPSSE